jgi:hypothetical protein
MDKDAEPEDDDDELYADDSHMKVRVGGGTT